VTKAYNDLLVSIWAPVAKAKVERELAERAKDKRTHYRRGCDNHQLHSHHSKKAIVFEDLGILRDSNHK